jgi:hypothetical protein
MIDCLSPVQERTTHNQSSKGFLMMSKLAARRTLLLAIIAMGMSGAAFAATPPLAASTGLGQAWPNTSDLSTNPNWHVYVFSIGGVQYLQVNDLAGNVLGAVGTVSGQFITLPIGAFSQLVSTPQQAAAATSSATPTASPTTVYNDGATQVTTTPMSDGTTMIKAAAAQTTCDPIDCNTKAQ